MIDEVNKIQGFLHKVKEWLESGTNIVSFSVSDVEECQKAANDLENDAWAYEYGEDL